MSHRVVTTDVNPSMNHGIVHSHFNVQAHAPQKRLLAWRDRVGHMIDVVPSLSDLDKPFQASIDRYSVGGLVFTDCRSDSMLLERSLARISTDNVRDYVFQVFLEGDVDNLTVRASPGNLASSKASILALDMGQPVRMWRNRARLLTFIVPGTVAAGVFPDPESIHGRTIHGTTPLTRLIIDHVTALSQDIAHMSADAADGAIRASAQLLVAAFGRQALLSGDARAAARAAMFGQVRRYIQAHLSEAALSPEIVLNALQLPRQTLYRMFQHEGGVGAYIRHLRLRRAADRMTRDPHVTMTHVAFDLGFKSSADFTRAFRRAYGMAPRDFRMQALGSTHARHASRG
jgi:AraC-like DNA-binding protein